MRSIKIFLVLYIILHIIAAVVVVWYFAKKPAEQKAVKAEKVQESYWFLLKRKSNKETLYRGVSGDTRKSKVIREFTVKTGVPGERPTPLPQKIGRKYWVITDKIEQYENPETAPYFLTLDVPGVEEEPFGPSPYLECDGQCNWNLPGAFGLHGVNGDVSRLNHDNPGSSGCIRHTDEDITFLYKLLDPKREEVRYYIIDV